MILVIDNYDSFTFNLVQALAVSGASLEVVRNDRLDRRGLAELAAGTRDEDRLAGIVISPGPGGPDGAGVSVGAVRFAAERRLPLLGVCLGHQAIGEAYGGRVIRAPRVMHGKTAPILHSGRGVLTGLPSPFTATRYHSLIVERDSLPDCLEVTAESEDGLIMALRHREHPVEGVQFHPESILTEHGHAMLKTFLHACEPAMSKA